MKACTILILLLLCHFSEVMSQQRQRTQITETDYLLYVPEAEPTPEGYPLMLFLHGSGERGDDLSRVKAHGPPSFLDDTTSFPFVVISPQCPPDQWWDTRALLNILDEVEAELPIDKNRVYVTGLSMGGLGTWALLKEAPDRFAAAAPVCGGGNPLAVCRFRDVPVWAFHGAKDDVVLPEESERMVNGLKEIGANVKFTLYPDANHNSWTVTYDNPELYSWLLSHSKKPSEDLKKKEMKAVEGMYRADDGEEMFITREEDTLRVSVPERKWEYKLTDRGKDTFAFPGRRSHEPERKLYFQKSAKNKTESVLLGPCENRSYRKIK